MKRLSFILLGLSFLLYACKETDETCLGFPTDETKYLATYLIGNEITYLATDHSDSIKFHCHDIDITGNYKRDWGTRCLCSAEAHQVLTSLNDTIFYTKTGDAYLEQTATRFKTFISISAFGLCSGLAFDEPWVGRDNPGNAPTNLPASCNAIYDSPNTPYNIYLEWTSADGTRYENVYHLVPDDGTALYLAPGYGIVQIETAGKTYCLKL